MIQRRTMIQVSRAQLSTKTLCVSNCVLCVTQLVIREPVLYVIIR
jgi:hypothetical protein